MYSQAQEYFWTANPREKRAEARKAGAQDAELDRFRDHRIRIDVFLNVDVSATAKLADVVRVHQPASVQFARVELQITTNTFRVTVAVAVHGLLGGGRFGHIGVDGVLRRAHDGRKSHHGAAVIVPRPSTSVENVFLGNTSAFARNQVPGNRAETTNAT